LSIGKYLIAENSAAIDFTKLIGNDMTVSLATLGEARATDWRYINSGYPARLI
jgi:hypothetical protein